MQNELLFILTVKGDHSSATRGQFIAGLQARGATVQFAQSRLGDFEVVRVNNQPVARAFKSKTDLITYLAR